MFFFSGRLAFVNLSDGYASSPLPDTKSFQPGLGGQQCSILNLILPSSLQKASAAHPSRNGRSACPCRRGRPHALHCPAPAFRLSSTSTGKQPGGRPSGSSLAGFGGWTFAQGLGLADVQLWSAMICPPAPAAPVWAGPAPPFGVARGDETAFSRSSTVSGRFSRRRLLAMRCGSCPAAWQPAPGSGHSGSSAPGCPQPLPRGPDPRAAGFPSAPAPWPAHR